uniref:Uncharacterized protein n=1 Tax=Magallana gigas TaxID=29159 RepID=A0A8W8HMZ2_MAGGI
EKMLRLLSLACIIVCVAADSYYSKSGDYYPKGNHFGGCGPYGCTYGVNSVGPHGTYGGIISSGSFGGVNSGFVGTGGLNTGLLGIGGGSAAASAASGSGGLIAPFNYYQPGYSYYPGQIYNNIHSSQYYPNYYNQYYQSFPYYSNPYFGVGGGSAAASAAAAGNAAAASSAAASGFNNFNRGFGGLNNIVGGGLRRIGRRNKVY